MTSLILYKILMSLSSFSIIPLKFSFSLLENFLVSYSLLLKPMNSFVTSFGPFTEDTKDYFHKLKLVVAIIQIIIRYKRSFIKV